MAAGVVIAKVVKVEIEVVKELKVGAVEVRGIGEVDCVIEHGIEQAGNLVVDKV